MSERPASHHGQLPVTAYLLFLVWLEAGYTAAIALFAPLAWTQAAWQAALLVATAAPLLLAVLAVLSVPRRLRLPRTLLRLLWAIGSVGEFALPWLAWSGLFWLLNGGRESWGAALRASGAVAVLSYLTGLWLVLHFHPRAEDVEITRLDIPIRGLPESFDGYQILHVSDLHAGSFVRVREVARRLAVAASLQPDLVVFTGDLASAAVGAADGAAEILSRTARGDGILAVLGNHDVWVGEAAVRAALERRGVRVLVNDHAAVSRGQHRLYFAGVNDAAYTERDDLAAALAGIPEEATVILLSHAPVIVRQPLARRAALVLSGHTHGGQIVLPYLGALYVPSELGRRYAFGLHRLNGQWLFITRGLGEIFPPLRIGCPPEIALLTLRRQQLP